jgi:hypothetical protein
MVEYTIEEKNILHFVNTVNFHVETKIVVSMSEEIW